MGTWPHPMNLSLSQKKHCPEFDQQQNATSLAVRPVLTASLKCWNRVARRAQLYMTKMQWSTKLSWLPSDTSNLIYTNTLSTTATSTTTAVLKVAITKWWSSLLKAWELMHWRRDVGRWWKFWECCIWNAAIWCIFIGFLQAVLYSLLCCCTIVHV